VISFSTSYMNQPALDMGGLQLPANTHAVVFMPLRTVSPDAALVVTPAGRQTVSAALADGVPLPCIPDGRDQPGNAARVVFVDAGVQVRKKTSPQKLGRVIAARLKTKHSRRRERNGQRACSQRWRSQDRGVPRAPRTILARMIRRP
jgi:UDP:flavonoid glycosyltransferase YjiC (YdhE family)